MLVNLLKALNVKQQVLLKREIDFIYKNNAYKVIRRNEFLRPGTDLLKKNRFFLLGFR